MEEQNVNLDESFDLVSPQSVQQMVNKELRQAEQKVETLFDPEDSDFESNRKIIDHWYNHFKQSLQEKHEVMFELKQLQQELRDLKTSQTGESIEKQFSKQNHRSDAETEAQQELIEAKQKMQEKDEQFHAFIDAQEKALNEALASLKIQKRKLGHDLDSKGSINLLQPNEQIQRKSVRSRYEQEDESD